MGRILGPLAVVIGVVGQVLEDRLENQQRVALHEARQKTHALFWDSANAVRSEFTRHLDRYLNDYYGQLLTETEKQMKELEGGRGKRSDDAQKFHAVADEALALIGEIHLAEGIVEVQTAPRQQ